MIQNTRSPSAVSNHESNDKALPDAAIAIKAIPQDPMVAGGNDEMKVALPEVAVANAATKSIPGDAHEKDEKARPEVRRQSRIQT